MWFDFDYQECSQCADEVLALSSRGWCDGCEEEFDLATQV